MANNIGHESTRRVNKRDIGEIMKGKGKLVASNAQKTREVQAKRGRYPISGVPAGCKQSAAGFHIDRCGGSSCCIGCRHKPSRKKGK